MSLDGVSRQYRQITGQDSPTDQKKVKASSKTKPDAKAVVEAPAEGETVVEVEAPEES